MTDATYSIEIQSDPHSVTWPYRARITRLSDGELRELLSASTREEAVSVARAWVVAENSRTPGDTLYVGDDGQDAEVPL